MFRYGFFAIGFCLLLTSGYSQPSSQIDSAFVVGSWINAADPKEHYEFRADGQFSGEFLLDQRVEHVEGTWDLHENALIMHLAPFAASKAQWDGQAFVDEVHDRFVRVTSASTAPSQSVASSSVPATAGSSMSADQKRLWQKILLWERLNSQFKATKTTDDKSDIVTAGSVLVLKKDGLLMYSIDAKVIPTSTYKNGKVSMGFGATLSTNLLLGHAQSGLNTSNVPQRKFVAGEKFWLTAFDIQEGNVVFQFYSDPYEDVRYQGQLTFPYPKHNMPPADEMLKTIAEVLTGQPDDSAAANAPARESQSEQVMAPIPAPPPPPDQPPPPPKTISKGDTKDYVVAAFGQPEKMVKLGAKEIYYYKDLKVTFVNGKVTDVQ